MQDTSCYVDSLLSGRYYALRSRQDQLAESGLQIRNTTFGTTWAIGKRDPGCLVYIGDEILTSYIGMMIDHYNDPDPY